MNNDKLAQIRLAFIEANGMLCRDDIYRTFKLTAREKIELLNSSWFRVRWFTN